MRSLDSHHSAAGRTTAAIVLVIATWVTIAAQNAQLKLVSTAWPPFTNAPKHTRFALDLVEAPLGRLGVTAKTAIVMIADRTYHRMLHVDWI